MKYSLLLLFLLLLFSARAENIDHQVKKVVIYKQAAEVTRTATTELSAGVQKITFSGLSPYIDESTLRVAGEGDFIIISSSVRSTHLKWLESEEYLDLQTRKEELESAIDEARIKLETLQQEEALLLQNKEVKGADVGLQVEQLKALLELYRDQLLNIKREQLEVKKLLNNLQKQLDPVLAEIEQLRRSQQNKRSSEVILTLDAEKAARVQLTVQYLVRNVSWSPFYEIYATDDPDQLKIKARANVYQQSGEDWHPDQLVLSTGNPYRGVTPPLLSPWKIPYEYAIYQQAQGARKINAQTDEVMVEEMPADAGYEVAVSQNVIFKEFMISDIVPLPSSSEPAKVSLKTYTPESVSYIHYTVPRLQEKVYLKALVEKWENLDLTEGNAFIYLNNNYAGKIHLNPDITSDTLEISLGIDESVTVDRQELEDFRDRKFLSNKVEEKRAYRITVRNNHKYLINIKIEDQIPITTDDRVDIDHDIDDGGQLNKNTGIISWNKDVGANKTEVVSFSFEVDAPEGLPLRL